MTQESPYEEQPKRNRVQEPGRGAWIRVDGAEIESSDEGRYEVRIRGHNLRMIVSPPAIDIGGEPLEQVSFEDDGKTIRGTVSTMPQGDRVVVDYGFARDEGELNRRGSTD